jgi:organic hydroperoxide reductase OsmC/OhrA
MRRKSNSASKEAKAMKRFGSATRNGSLRDDKGAVSTESQATTNHPGTLFSRYGETAGTNPEQLLRAAHAASFTMSFVRMLGMANFVAECVDSKSDIAPRTWEIQKRLHVHEPSYGYGRLLETLPE